MKRPGATPVFRDLDPNEAFRLSERLRADALYVENGRSVAVRDPELLAADIEMRRHVLLGLVKAWGAARRTAQGNSSAESKKDDAKHKLHRSRDSTLGSGRS